MSGSPKMDDVLHPAPLCLVADTPRGIRWPNSSTSSVFSFPWKPEGPSSSDDAEGYDFQPSDYEDDSSSSSEPSLSSSLSSPRGVEDSENCALQRLLDYCAELGVHACSNRIPKNSGRNLSALIDKYKTLNVGRKDVGPNDALQAARESRTLATEICNLLQSMDNRNMCKYRSGKPMITDELARQIYLDTVPTAYRAARDLSKHLDRRHLRAVFV